MGVEVGQLGAEPIDVLCQALVGVGEAVVQVANRVVGVVGHVRVQSLVRESAPE